MALILTPGQLRDQSEFYRQLGSLTHAGLGVMAAFHQLRAHPPGRAMAVRAARVLAELERGATLTEALRRLGPDTPVFDTALVEAGEQSGRLDQSFKLLADYYEDRARLARQLINDLMYPAFLLHFAVFILPFAEFFKSGNLGVYLVKTLGLLLPLYAGVLALVYACQSRHGENWRARMESAGRLIPVLGRARHNLALARLAAALEALISAGVPIFRAWELAGAASGSPALRRVVASWKSALESGRTPAELVRGSREFPSLFAGLYSGGEISGRLDHELRHLHDLYLEEGSRQMRIVSTWAPKIIYLLIVLAVAWQIVSFYASYYGEADRLMREE